MAGHPVIERQVAALHRVIAGMIEAGDPRPAERALQNLERWRSRFGGSLPQAYAEWDELLLAGDTNRILSILTGSDQDAIRRRSSSPFTGILSQRERMEIMRRAA